MRHALVFPLLVAASFATLVLGACNRQQDVTTPALPPAPASVAAPAAASVAAAAPVATTRTATFKGYGELAFGMPSKEIRETWKGPLAGNAPANPGDCYQLATDPAAPGALSLMIEGDKLVRYDVRGDAQVAPGGGKVGMGIDTIRKLYVGRVREQPAKYAPGGVDLRVGADDDSGSALIFQTDGAGKVTSWRVGQSPAVDDVEGCS